MQSTFNRTQTPIRPELFDPEPVLKLKEKLSPFEKAMV
jgi:hypothetical protein